MIAIIRFIVLFIYFILMNFALVLVYLVKPMHRDNVALAGKFYSSMAFILGIKLVKRCSNAVDPNESYVFIGNHQNTYDLATISSAASPGVVTVGKKSIKWIPIFGLIYWLSGNIMIDRKNIGKAKDTLSLTGEKMREKNLSIFMFPEGTRSKGRGLMKFKTGAFRLAISEKKKIVPVICSELNNGKIKFNRWNNGTVIVQTLDPVEIDLNQNVKQMTKQFHEQMLEVFDRITKEAEQLSH